MSSTTYPRAMILVHWLTAALVISAFILVWLAEDQEKSVHQQLVGWHRSVGISVLALTLLRIVLRVASRVPAMIETALWQVRAARLTHAGFYLLLLATPAAGWLMSSAAGRTVSWFGLIDLPALTAPDKPFAKLLHELHETAATAMLVLIGVHAAAALWHHYLVKDDTLARMLPLLKRR